MPHFNVAVNCLPCASNMVLMTIRYRFFHAHSCGFTGFQDTCKLRLEIIRRNGTLDRGARQWMGPRWRQPEHARKDDTQSCPASLEGRVLLSSPAKLEDGGQRKHGISCDTWPKQELVGNLSLSNEERRLRG